MTIDFYQIPESPPCRTVIFTAQHLRIKLNDKHLDLFTGEHLKPEFLKINPQHTVPVINDDGFYLTESRAIATYLVNKYAPNNPIYPEDPKKRAVIDRMLYLDTSLFAVLRDMMMPLWQKGTLPSQELLEALKKQLTFFEEFLGKTSYAAADHITLADFSFAANIEHLKILNIDLSGYPRITAWMQKLKKEIPNFHEINEVPVQKCKEYFKNKKLIS
ncbi:glutathione S-transferase 2-like [Uloborus diversus]|uniref:glutathione S-transferase 2-like n=1 Tax=Uloborus diversus TaxID=327109 RepID=UPI00240A7899|nr:glutathione S-transferase 2-like [Uloborus diversus]